MSDYKPASEAQRNYIRKLVKERAKDLSAIPHLVGQGDERVDQLSFEEAKTVLRYLTELPEPEVVGGDEITDQQRSKIWAQLKDHGYNTHQVFLLKRDDDGIPYVGEGGWDEKVWDWIGRLSKSQAREVIDYLGG
jgi:hypothetical protein